jgi:hypothetical protein
MKKNILSLMGFLLLIISVRPAFAGWMAYADFTSCPRKYLPNTSGQEGPFSSASDCQSAIDNASREAHLTCARYSCKEIGSGSSESSANSAAPGHQLDKNIGDAVAAGVSGQISGADAVGLVGLGLMGNALLGAAAPETPEQAAERQKNQQLWAEQSAKAAEASRLKEVSYQMEQDAKSFAMLDVAAAEFSQSSSAPAPAPIAAPVKQPEVSQAFSKGFDHASSCISQNSGAACAGSTSPTCIADYRAGYDAGSKKQKLMMQEAFQAGKSAGANGEPMSGGESKSAAGPCRVEWIQQYNKGHWAGRHPKVTK